MTHSFSVYQNEITVILGTSGCGKTTVMKHLVGLYPIQKGEVTILGKRIDSMDEDEFAKFKLNMGVLFQKGALLNSLSVAENISIAEKLVRKSAAKGAQIILLQEVLVSLIS